MRIQVETKIANTVMENYDNKVFFITPLNSYTLHHNSYDFQELDTNEVTYGYSTSGVSVPLDYDFSANPFNLYTKLRSEVPENQIFGNTPNTEVM